MVSRRVSGDPSFRFIVTQGKDSIASATNFKSACLLEILTLEKDLAAGYPVDRGGGQHRGSMDKGLDPLMGSSDIFQRRFCFHTYRTPL